MKKIIILITLIAIGTSCSNDSENDTSSTALLGVWHKTNDLEDYGNLSESLQYGFNADHSVTVTRVIIENSTSEIKGYRYKANGTFQINENELEITLSEIYYHDDSFGFYSNINDLKLSGDEAGEKVTFFVNRRQKSLTFIFPPCASNAICIDHLTFEKLDE